MAATDIKTKENGNPSTEQKSSTFFALQKLANGLRGDGADVL